MKDVILSNEDRLKADYPKLSLIGGVDANGDPEVLHFDGDGGLKVSTQGTEGGTPLVVGGVTNRVAVEFTRPSDTTAYTIGDAVCNSTSAPVMLTFSNVARINGGTGIILTGRLTTDSATVANGSFRLYIFNDTVTPTNDNSAFALVYANLAKRIGYIDFSLAAEASGACSIALTTGVNLDYAAATGSRNLYGILIAKGAYVPASGQKFTVELGVAND